MYSDRILIQLSFVFGSIYNHLEILPPGGHTRVVGFKEIVGFNSSCCFSHAASAGLLLSTCVCACVCLKGHFLAECVKAVRIAACLRDRERHGGRARTLRTPPLIPHLNIPQKQKPTVASLPAGCTSPMWCGPGGGWSRGRDPSVLGMVLIYLIAEYKYLFFKVRFWWTLWDETWQKKRVQTFKPEVVLFRPSCPLSGSVTLRLARCWVQMWM